MRDSVPLPGIVIVEVAVAQGTLEGSVGELGVVLHCNNQVLACTAIPREIKRWLHAPPNVVMHRYGI